MQNSNNTIQRLCNFIEFANSQNIAIDVARKTVIHGEEDLVITCSLLRYSELLKVDSIRLLRNSSGGSEQVMGTLTDTQRPLPTQIPGVRVTGSLRPLWSAKLSFTLAKEFVDCQNERAGYMCSLTGMDQSFIPVQQFTEQVPVDVAGIYPHYVVSYPYLSMFFTNVKYCTV